MAAADSLQNSPRALPTSIVISRLDPGRWLHPASSGRSARGASAPTIIRAMGKAPSRFY